MLKLPRRAVRVTTAARPTRRSTSAGGSSRHVRLHSPISSAHPERTERHVMHELLARILDAHGGIDRWNAYEKVEATIVSGGGLFPLKGVAQDATPRRMTVWLHEERSSVFPYGAPDQRTMFTSER